MKRIYAATFAFLVISVLTLAGSAAPLPDQHIHNLNDDFFQSFNKLDLERFNQIVSNEAMFTVDNDSVQTKAQVEQAFSSHIKQVVKDSGHDTDPAGIRNVKVIGMKIIDNTAVVVGRIWVRVKDKNERYGFTNAFVKNEEGEWKLVTSSSQKLK